MAVVETRAEGPVGFLAFNRPGVLNAFDPELIEEASLALGRLADDPQIAAIVVHGAGRAFSAGFDIKASAGVERDAAEWRRVLEADFDFIMRFWDCPKPTIAAVHGYCIGGAFEVMLACDIAVAAAGTRFGEPEVRFGSGAVALLLPWITGAKAAKELLLTGEDRLGADRALALGLVNHVVPEGEEVARAEAIARDIAGGAPNSVRLTKLALNRSYEIMGMRGALLQALEIDIAIESAGGPERSEFNRIRRSDGLKAAIAWRDARFGR